MLLLVAALLPPVAALAQTSAPPVSSSPAPAATDTQPVFEVAAIKENHSANGNSNSDTNQGRFKATNVSLKNLIQYDAYGIPGPRILDGPKWLDSAKFDIDAKTEDSVTEHLQGLDNKQRKAESQAMFQQLLADRFKLAVHWETRELPIYALVVLKNGSKLQPTKETGDGSGTSTNGNGSTVQFTAKNISIPELAESLTQELSQEVGRTILDKTGIEGKYDLTLKWATSLDSTPVSNAADGASPNSLPSIFTAIQEQLGLKLESSKGPVQVLVVDHAEMPSEN
jgi:uncharacterized protein (TIGR03435 family)